MKRDYSNTNNPSVTFHLLGSVKHEFAEAPCVFVMAYVKSDQDYKDAGPQEALDAGIRVPNGQHLVVLPYNLSEQPPFDEVRPKEKGDEVVMHIGTVSFSGSKKVCAIFAHIGHKPENDAITVRDEFAMNRYVQSLEDSLRRDPADSTNIAPLLGFMRPLRDDVSQIQALTYSAHPAMLN